MAEATALISSLFNVASSRGNCSSSNAYIVVFPSLPLFFFVFHSQVMICTFAVCTLWLQYETRANAVLEGVLLILVLLGMLPKVFKVAGNEVY